MIPAQNNTLNLSVKYPLYYCYLFSIWHKHWWWIFYWFWTIFSFLTIFYLISFKCYPIYQTTLVTFISKVSIVIWIILCSILDLYELIITQIRIINFLNIWIKGHLYLFSFYHTRAKRSFLKPQFSTFVNNTLLIILEYLIQDMFWLLDTFQTIPNSLIIE